MIQRVRGKSAQREEGTERGREGREGHAQRQKRAKNRDDTKQKTLVNRSGRHMHGLYSRPAIMIKISKYGIPC